ncbi:VOC family protein [Pseudonocardia endophytica]|uniref:Putative enzyme related to lactoylglutathione lyase n=1 Tax=Pseudonocardia endophytica TaxID=401976 RepID=A0A4R1HSZ2_PSEEN|nr:VOC family protein [Pseudonocardia endophytica]TCK24471.1 putative enzyme related to lactoylglutathione lyase [Pseudonocardia endophytica]
MQPTHVLAGLAVSDIDRAVAWYADLLGRPADSVPMPSCHEWTLGTDVTLQVAQNAHVTAGQGQLTLSVENLEGAMASTAAEFDEITEVSEFVRFATTRDPDGNAVTVVEPKR